MTAKAPGCSAAPGQASAGRTASTPVACDGHRRQDSTECERIAPWGHPDCRPELRGLTPLQSPRPTVATAVAPGPGVHKGYYRIPSSPLSVTRACTAESGPPARADRGLRRLRTSDHAGVASV